MPGYSRHVCTVAPSTSGEQTGLPTGSTDSTTSRWTNRPGLDISGRLLTSMAGIRARELYSWCHIWMRRRWTLLRSSGMMNYMTMTFWWNCWATGLTQRHVYRHPGLAFMAGHGVITRMQTHSPTPLQNFARLATHRARRSSARSWSVSNLCADNGIRSSKSTCGWWFVPRRTGNSRHWLRRVRILPALARL